jgi:hypothetical protein
MVGLYDCAGDVADKPLRSIELSCLISAPDLKSGVDTITDEFRSGLKIRRPQSVEVCPPPGTNNRKLFIVSNLQ